MKTIRIQRAARDMNTIMADPYPIRPVTADEYAGFHRVLQHAFNGGAPVSEVLQARRLRQFEPERSLAAFDTALSADEALVGTTGVYSLRMTVPGAVLPVAGVTTVSVLPSHRRRGVLRSLMHRQLADLAARGEEPIAALWASETPIYARYGYGRASSAAYFRFERGDGAMAPTAPVDPALTLRLAEPRAATAELAKVYKTVLPMSPGFFARTEDWWGRVLHDEPEERRGGFGPLRCLLAEDHSGVRGYALYETAQRWHEPTSLPDGLLVVREVIAADPAAGAALWHNLLTRDLVSTVTAGLRPAEDPLLSQLLDQRRARVQVADGLWVRIIDLPGALAKRVYSCPVDVVIEVTDDLLAGNAGRWRLRADGPGLAGVAGLADLAGLARMADLGALAELADLGGRSGVADRPGVRASCKRTDRPADIALDIRELGAAYLGGTRLGTLAAAGLVRELRPGALIPLSSAMTWDPAPWCPQIF
jgi:predicted acetyltransferase